MAFTMRGPGRMPAAPAPIGTGLAAATVSCNASLRSLPICRNALTHCYSIDRTDLWQPREQSRQALRTACGKSRSAACSWLPGVPRLLAGAACQCDGSARRLRTRCRSTLRGAAAAEADIYTPVAQQGAKPVVIFFYGGNWQTGAKSDYLFVKPTR